MQTAIDLSKAVDQIEDNKELKEMVGINPETGEFDIDFVPEAMRADVIAMGKSMIQSQKKKGCNRKKKPRAKVKKSFGKNKKKKKK